MVDVAGIEPATPCLQSKHKFNLSHCFGCAYEFEAPLRLLQRCSKNSTLMTHIMLVRRSRSAVQLGFSGQLAGRRSANTSLADTGSALIVPNLVPTVSSNSDSPLKASHVIQEFSDEVPVAQSLA